MNKLGSTAQKILAAALLSANLTVATAQQVKCISESSSWLFGSTNKSACYVWKDRKEIKEWETIEIDWVVYTMSKWQVKSKIDYSKPKIDPKDCKVESYANADWAWSRVICGWKVITDSQTK